MSKKIKILSILFLFILFSFTSLQAQPYGKNGIAYVLFTEDVAKNPNCVTEYNGSGGSGTNRNYTGVWRFNDSNGDPIKPIKSSSSYPWKVFNSINGTKGLSASQELKTNVFLLQPGSEATSLPATISRGLVPNIVFKDDCPFWVKVVEPAEMSAPDSAGNAWTQWSSTTAITGNYAKAFGAHGTGYWKRVSGSYSGASYNFRVDFGGPAGVQYLDANPTINGPGSGASPAGTPMWDGPGSGEYRHPDYNDPSKPGYRKIILPSHFAAVGYYLYTTRNQSTYPAGTPMDGVSTTDVLTYVDANKFGNAWVGMTEAQKRNPNTDHSTSRDQYFGCVVKMIYRSSTRDLNLRRGYDETNEYWPTKTINGSMDTPKTGMLQISDYEATQFLGKWCGDNCIPGSGLNAQDSGGVFSDITVTTTTTGNVYGFNPDGDPEATDIKAMLRVVYLSGSTDVPLNVSGFNNFSNNTYLQSFSRPVSDLKTIGVSSNFSAGERDYIYGSFAPYYVVQDSWWGQGGIAYEIDDTGKVTKFDYLNSTDGNPVSKVEFSEKIEGSVDDIAIDGDAYLYVLKTEGKPKDTKCTSPGLSVYSTDGTYWETFDGENILVSVSGWFRSTDGGPIPIAAPSEENDYRDVTLQQKIYKNIYRYKEADSSLGAEEHRGSMLTGYDYWQGRIRWHKTGSSSGYATMDDTFFPSGDPKVAAIKSELAVVNVAAAPVTFPGTEDHYIVVKGETDKHSGFNIEEDSPEVDFKIEGYKPVIDGTQKYFRALGNIELDDGDILTNLRINNCFNNTDGGMLHDEDSNGVSSGFASNMFESSAHNTVVKWYIYQVEDKTEKNIIGPSANAKVIKKCLDGTGPLAEKKSTSNNTICDCAYKFNQPGRYIVQASIQYYYFKDLGNTLRPKYLKEKITQSAVLYTAPFLVNVYAKDLKLNDSDSYITNVTLESENNKSSHGVADGIIPDSGSDFDTCEGTEFDNKFGDLTIQFDAKFFGYKQESTNSSFETYDGIGVWDYNYYQAIYKKMFDSYGIGTQYTDEKLRFSTLGKSDYTNSSVHVYNYINNDISGGVSGSSYNTNYNPGFERVWPDGTKNYQAGTNGTGEIYNCDKAFIQWVLYLRPFPKKTPKSIPQTIVADDDPRERGLIIASGTIIDAGLGAEFTHIADDRGLNRNYHVKFTIKDIDSKINVPRDPERYYIDLELIYPRVFWLLDEENDSTGNKVYRSSLVPYNPQLGEPAPAPVHILSDLTPITESTNNLFNQSTSADTSGGDNIFDSAPEITLCVRDCVPPKFLHRGNPSLSSEQSDYFNVYGSAIQLPYYESTGDPIMDATFDYGVEDNNPFMRFARDYTPTDVIATTSAKTALNLYCQNIDTSGTYVSIFDGTDGMKKYVKKESMSGYPKTHVRQTDYDNKTFYTNNDWKLYVTYRNKIEKISALAPDVHGSYNITKPISSASLGNYPWKISVDNWVGSLSYTINGKVYDGYGKDGQDYEHYLYCSDVKDKIDGSFPEDYVPTSTPTTAQTIEVAANRYLSRLDNDPPCIGVQLISQSDNRKWDFQLIEGVNDNKAFAKTDSDLAKCTLTISCQDLAGSPVAGFTPVSLSNVHGSTNVYDPSGYTNPDTQSVSAPTANSYIVKTEDYNGTVPAFRKSSRLLINVDVFDNCGFKALASGSIIVKDIKQNKVLASHNFTDNERAASHNTAGNIIKFIKEPRVTIAVDLPTVIMDNDKQIEVIVYAEDADNNKRQLELPIKLTESSFDTHVIEHRENKQ